MHRLTMLFAATAMTVALGASALAQSRGQSAPMLYFTHPDGTVESMEMTDQSKVDMLMKSARKLPPGTIVYTSNGALYIAEDTKMANGKMLSDALMH